MINYLIFALTSICYAFYSWSSIRFRKRIYKNLSNLLNENECQKIIQNCMDAITKNYGWDWHISQWLSALLFMVSGIMFYKIGINWHNFGNVFLIMIFFYIIPLRLFQRYLK